jgi:hypothetical protein
MNRIILLISLSLLSFVSFGQSNNNIKDSTPKLQELDFSDVFIGDKFKSTNRNDLYDRTEPIGYFGNGYQRIFIHFISVVQNKDNPLEYFVYGKSKLKDNVSSFQGTITISKINEYIRHEYPEFSHGEIKGTYNFYEDPKNNGSGKFEGTFSSNWLLDKDGKIEYDAMMLGADGYSNNQFNGVWISYSSNNEYVCNWGDYRIPNSGDLDVGAGEFFPNETYHSKGWKTYDDQFGDPNDPQTNKARESEKAEWWKD